ncbi:MAG: hypothetical protein IKZ10_06645 [Akkermansia sp.]|nr:hypothetical protein [Akkermansia sp.]
MEIPEADVPENLIQQLSPELLSTLLVDHTTSSTDTRINIFWATNDYANRGKGYQYSDQITPESITGTNGLVIMPRVLKSKDAQQERVQSMAEVFTPSWVRNTQNNLIDNAGLGASLFLRI